MPMRQFALPLNRFHWPTHWDETFSRSGLLTVEVGFGNGQYLVHMAEHSRNENFVGLERSIPSIRNAERKIAQAKLQNVCLVRAAALSALWLLFQASDISALIINFPDPWPKSSHQHRRVVCDNFLNLAASRMRYGGRLEIATDHGGYAAWITERLARSPYFESDLTVAYTTKHQERSPTKYELKAIKAGLKCHYFKWSRNSTLSAETFSAPEEYVMPHLILQTPLDLHEIEKSFESRQVEDGTTKVRFIAMYHSVKINKLVVDTFIHEEPLEQRVLLSIEHRKTGDLMVSLHESGYPRSTQGIHLAVYWLAEWIKGSAEPASITRHNLHLDS